MEIVQRVTVREFPDGERRSIDSARREHRGHARTVFEPRVEHRLALGDLVAACTRDVLDRDWLDFGSQSFLLFSSPTRCAARRLKRLPRSWVNRHSL
jgi:hypothetical protein